MTGWKMSVHQVKRYPIDPERLAYWYLRLNGFLTIENFCTVCTAQRKR